MCDQTEVIYSPGDVVWVKLGPVWWPGQVHDYDKLPEEITSNLRKKPIAVVKFFQEDSYEYVKNLNSIYHYNCRRKHEFIKKGLDMCRSNNRDVPSNMKMFPNDIATAEHITNGDPNILNDEEFAPEEKGDYSEIFGKKSPKKGKTDSVKKELTSWRLKGFPESSLKGGRRSLPTPTIPRPITHPRFITKALQGRSDHEVRIRQQSSYENCSLSDTPVKQQYNCHLCGFSSSRINVIVLHNKSHSAGYADAYLPPQQQSGKGRKIKSERKLVYSSEKRSRISDIFKSDEPPIKRKNYRVTVDSSASCKREISDKSGKSNITPAKSVPALKKPVFGRKKTAKDKAEKLAKEKQQNDAFRETLLKDWDEDEDNEDEAFESSKEDDSSKEKDNSMDSTSDKITSDKKQSSSKAKEISCFDFDDSEDGLNIGETVMKFGQKIPRLLGDKTKKQTKSLLEEGSFNIESVDGKAIDSNDVNSKNDSDKKACLVVDEKKEPASETVSNESKERENEDLDSAFKSLLTETVVPVIPDAPSHIEIKKKTVDSETSSRHSQLINTVDEINIDSAGGGGEESGSGEEEREKKSSETEIKEVEVKEEVHENLSESVSKGSPVGEGVQDLSNVDDCKETSFVDTEHFLVKTSEEVATSSSDNILLEGRISPSKLNVALPKIETVSEETNEKSFTPNLNISFVKETAVGMGPQLNSAENTPSTHASLSADLDTNIRSQSEGVLLSHFVTNPEVNKSSVNINESLTTDVPLSEDNAVPQTSAITVVQSHSSASSKGNNLQEIEFDINSMPVIISEEMVQEQIANKSNSFSTDTLMSVKSVANAVNESKLMTVTSTGKTTVDIHAANNNNNNNKNVFLKEEMNSSSQTVFSGKDNKSSSRKVLLSSTKSVASSRPSQVTTIKVQPTATAAGKLTVPGGIISQKSVGGTSQVLILKSALGQHGKSTLQKISGTSQMIQQGGKVLILTNPQGSCGQSKVLSTLSTQKSISPGTKLTTTRILTTKGTVLTTGSQGVISKANILSGASKTVTTKSGQKFLINKGGVVTQTPKSVIINKSGVLTSSVNSSTIVSTKGPLIAQNILSSKAELATSQINSSQIAMNSKGATATILTSPCLTSKGMILTPVSSNKGATLSNNQKLRLITTKTNPAVAATSNSGTKLMIQSSPSRMILPSSSLVKNQPLKLVGNIKNQSSTSTILIQTSQGVIATTPLTSNQMGNKSKATKTPLPTVISSALSPKTTTLQVSQAVPQSPNKLLVQKVKPSGPNILQKTQKKLIQRNTKRNTINQLITTSISAAPSVQSPCPPVSVSSLGSATQDTLILSSTSALPVAGQSHVVQQGSQLESSSQPALVYLTVDESGNYRPLESTPVVNYEGATSDSQTLYIDPGTTDLDNIFLAIDDAGNVVNITQPVQSPFTTASSTPPPGQDILAKALANTQVLQQETIPTENIPLTTAVESSMLGGCMFVEPSHTQYPQQSLSHNVLETSLTLNQPIMTPLEVPSAVSPRSLDQISSLQTNFLSDSSLLTTNAATNRDKRTTIRPSMPLLTEESDSSVSAANIKNETVYFTRVDVDGSQAVLTPVKSGPQLGFQLALDKNNVIVSSTPGMSSLGVISNTTVPQSSLTFIPQSESQTVTDVSDQKPFLNINNAHTTSAVFTHVTQKNNVIGNYQLTNKLLSNEGSLLSGGNLSTKTDTRENIVMSLSEESVSPNSVVYKNESEIQHWEDEKQSAPVENVVGDEKPIVAHDKSLLVSASQGSDSNALSISSHHLSETPTTDSYSDINADQISRNDQRLSIFNTPEDVRADGGQVLKTEIDAVDIKEAAFSTITTDSSILSSNGNLTQTGKRHLDDVSSPSASTESKKFKLEER